MASLAIELQNAHPEHSYQPGDYIFAKSMRDPTGTLKIVLLNEKEGAEDLVNPKWIPRIDQLKEILGHLLPKPWEGKEGKKAFYAPDRYYGAEGLLEMVMDNLYSKKWSGADWQ